MTPGATPDLCRPVLGMWSHRRESAAAQDTNFSKEKREGNTLAVPFLLPSNFSPCLPLTEPSKRPA